MRCRDVSWRLTLANGDQLLEHEQVGRVDAVAQARANVLVGAGQKVFRKHAGVVDVARARGALRARARGRGRGLGKGREGVGA